MPSSRPICHFLRSLINTRLIAPPVRHLKPNVIIDDHAPVGTMIFRIIFFSIAAMLHSGSLAMALRRGRSPVRRRQDKVVPSIFRDGGTPSSWLAVLDKIAALNPLHVLPTHSAPADGSLVAAEKQFITDLRNTALDLKKRGVPVEEAGKRLESDFKTKYPTWPSMNVAGFVRSIYGE